VQIDGRNYLLPVDIDPRDEFEVKDEAVDIDDLFVSRLEHARARVRIVILDACRDNPFNSRSRGARSVGAGLVEMGARGALIAYSSAPGATAEDGPPGTNSAFTRHLVKEMLAEGLEVEQMFKNVRVKVLRDTNQRQIPWVNSSLVSNFSFNPGVPGDAADAARREDLARLQATLDRREREQRELEDKVRRLSRQLEQAQATGQLAATPPQAAAAPTPQTPVADSPQASLTDTPQGPLTQAPLAPAANASPAPAPESQQVPVRVAPQAPPMTVVPQAPVKLPAPAPEKVAQASANHKQPGRKGEPNAASERCVALLIRAQLGEPLTSAELAHLQKECR
jgi:hypothetical protein